MENVFRGLQWETLLIYLDDIIVFSQTVEEHLQQLEVFKHLRAASLKLKPRKCLLFATRVDYLGHVIDGNGIHTDQQKVTTVQNWPQPRHRTDVRTFLGMTGYYRRFVTHYAELSKPLAKLTSKNEAFHWTDDFEVPFNSLKSALTESPIL